MAQTYRRQISLAGSGWESPPPVTMRSLSRRHESTSVSKMLRSNQHTFPTSVVPGFPASVEVLLKLPPGGECNQKDNKNAKWTADVYENKGDIEHRGKMSAFFRTKCPKSAPFRAHFGSESPLGDGWTPRDVKNEGRTQDVYENNGDTKYHSEKTGLFLDENARNRLNFECV